MTLPYLHRPHDSGPIQWACGGGFFLFLRSGRETPEGDSKSESTRARAREITMFDQALSRYHFQE